MPEHFNKKQMIDLQNITLEVVKLCRQVGSFMREQRRDFSHKNVEEKGAHDLVSYVDRQAESMIIDVLKKLLPGAGFIAEEGGVEPGERYQWIIDPLDGTTNYVHGIPLYSISIALQENEITVAGIVYEVNLDECFYAWEGGKAMLNGQEIGVSQETTLNRSLIATGFPYSDFSRMKPYLTLFDELMRSSRGLRRLGSAAVDLAYVACGRFEVFYEYGLNPWDVAAGAFIVEKAGGKLSCFIGGNEVVFSREIIASNGFVHNEFLGLCIKHFNAEQ